MTTTTSLFAGLAGAGVLTALHQATRAVTPKAPRMDVLGMRALAKMRRAAGADVPPRDELYKQTLAGDIVSNAAYYALVGAGRNANPWLRGAALGTLAGVGALVLPQRMGLGEPPASHSALNRALTVALYVAGGLAAAGVAHLLDRRSVAAEPVSIQTRESQAVLIAGAAVV